MIYVKFKYYKFMILWFFFILFNFDFFLILFIRIIRNYRYKNMIEEIYKDKVDDKLLQ